MKSRDRNSVSFTVAFLCGNSYAGSKTERRKKPKTDVLMAPSESPLPQQSGVEGEHRKEIAVSRTENKRGSSQNAKLREHRQLIEYCLRTNLAGRSSSYWRGYVPFLFLFFLSLFVRWNRRDASGRTGKPTKISTWKLGSSSRVTTKKTRRENFPPRTFP